MTSSTHAAPPSVIPTAMFAECRDMSANGGGTLLGLLEERLQFLSEQFMQCLQNTAILD